MEENLKMHIKLIDFFLLIVSFFHLFVAILSVYTQDTEISCVCACYSAHDSCQPEGNQWGALGFLSSSNKQAEYTEYINYGHNVMQCIQAISATVQRLRHLCNI